MRSHSPVCTLAVRVDERAAGKQIRAQPACEGLMRKPASKEDVFEALGRFGYLSGGMQERIDPPSGVFQFAQGRLPAFATGDAADPGAIFLRMAGHAQDMRSKDLDMRVISGLPDYAIILGEIPSPHCSAKDLHCLFVDKRKNLVVMQEVLMPSTRLNPWRPFELALDTANDFMDVFRKAGDTSSFLLSNGAVLRIIPKAE